ncbi:MAG TPA: hypothetical protein VIJ22_10665 [Polyangiaceae bacterium]
MPGRLWTLLLLAAAGQACAPATIQATPAPAPQAAPSSYATMQPLAQYVIPNPDEEVALARSAAPASISADAEILVLGKRGYETAVKGKNGFVCFVERSWANHFDQAEFWNPRVHSPNCYNAPAVHTVLPPCLKRTEWVLAGASKEQLIERTKAALVSKDFVDPEPGALSYMMSPQGHLSDADGHWHPHVMFFVPRAAAASWGWGANLPGSPIIAQEGEDNDPVTIFFIPVRRWSDGSPGPVPK